MEKALFNSMVLNLFGISLIVLNKPFGKLCQSFQKDILKNDYPIWFFRAPILVVGCISLSIGFLIIFDRQ